MYEERALLHSASGVAFDLNSVHCTVFIGHQLDKLVYLLSTVNPLNNAKLRTSYRLVGNRNGVLYNYSCGNLHCHVSGTSNGVLISLMQPRLMHSNALLKVFFTRLLFSYFPSHFWYYFSTGMKSQNLNLNIVMAAVRRCGITVGGNIRGLITRLRFSTNLIFSPAQWPPKKILQYTSAIPSFNCHN